MAGSWSQSKKGPKLERMNATKNPRYVPKMEDLSSDSLPERLNLKGVGEFQDPVTSFRIVGNNVEEEVETICRKIGISRLEFLGITPAAWDIFAERRSKSLPTPDSSNSPSSLVDDQTVESLSRTSSESSNSPLADQDRFLRPSFAESVKSQRDKTSLCSDKQKCSHLPHKSEEELYGSTVTAGTNASNIEPLKGLLHKYGGAVASKYESELDASPQGRITSTSSPSQKIFTPHTAPQLGYEKNSQKKADLTSASRFYQQNLQLQKSETRAIQHLFGTTNAMQQTVFQNSSPAIVDLCSNPSVMSSQFKNRCNISATTSQESCPVSTASEMYSSKIGSVTLNDEPTNLPKEEFSSDTKGTDNMVQNTTQTNSDARPRIPWSFWKKGELLGSGSFGTVYEGVNSEGFFFAVKEVPLNDEGRGGQESISQLEKEIEILSQYQHDNIVKYLGAQREQHKLYIFLELMPKGALSTLYKKIPLFDSQVRSYTRQILHGLKYLHEGEIVHRDIKCANILVHSNGTVKLADFGMAKVLGKSEQLKSLKGSACWMAPEVINPKKSYSFPADIWSLGCTVLEMATGRPPFSDLEWQAVIFKVGRGEAPPIPDRLPDDAKSFIQLCLQADPSLRPTAAALLEHPFVKTRFWHLTSIHSSSSPVLVESDDSLVDSDSGDLRESSYSERSLGTSSISSTDSREDEFKVPIAQSRSTGHSVRTRKSTRLL